MTIADQLRRDEGVRPFAYTDTAGNVTVGVGRNLKTVGLSISEIDLLLSNDISLATSTLQSRLPYFAALGEVRQAVLVNMCFNLGFNGLEKFALMLAAFAQGDWENAASEMLNSAWARQVGDRAVRLAQQVRTGQWA